MWKGGPKWHLERLSRKENGNNNWAGIVRGLRSYGSNSQEGSNLPLLPQRTHNSLEVVHKPNCGKVERNRSSVGWPSGSCCGMNRDSSIAGIRSQRVLALRVYSAQHDVVTFRSILYLFYRGTYDRSLMDTRIRCGMGGSPALDLAAYGRADLNGAAQWPRFGRRK